MSLAETNPQHTLMHSGESLPLSLDPIASVAFDFTLLDFTLEVERLYAGLLRLASTPSDGEPSLGGKLLYAGELNSQGRALMVAGNISGVASLAATADHSAQKLAIRDGVADFLVNSLDEALRILKNEIRKREAVAVCVAADPRAVECEMQERGVLPDLLPPVSFAESLSSDSFTDGIPRIELSPAQANEVLVVWRVAAAPAQWLPKIDALAMESLNKQAYASRRWLRLAPRYLGRLAQGLRMLHCEPGVANEFVARVRRAVESGEIGVEVEMRTGSNCAEKVFQFRPPQSQAP
jgi:hypothetical protein